MIRKTKAREKAITGIPRIIHQTWKTRDLSQTKGDVKSWRRLNPDWDYRFWTDADLENFMQAEFPELMEIYRGYPNPVQRADLARYCLLRRFGGVYADIDTICLASLEPLAGETRIVVCEEPPEHAKGAKRRGLPFLLFNGTMASPAQHPFWDDVIAKCVAMYPRKNIEVLDNTGPFLMTAAIVQWPDQQQFSINSCHLFAPVNSHHWKSKARLYGDHSHLRLSEHLWQGSWFEPWKRRPLPIAIARAMRNAISTLYQRRGETLARIKSRIDLELLSKPLANKKKPSVTILIPVRDGEAYLPHCFAALLSLDYPRQNLRILFGNGDSQDGTAKLIQDFIATQGSSFCEVALINITKNAPRLARNVRWKAKYQLKRRAGLALARNELLAAGLSRNADWFLWIDSDVEHYPASVLRDLLALREKIVAPHCVKEANGETFDLNTFLYAVDPKAEELRPHLSYGLYQPPKNHWVRRHLQDLRYLQRVPLHGVGGTMLLVDANVHRAGVVFPATPYRFLIETEAFGLLARDLGVVPVGVPNIEIIHPDR
nr:glycosyltransferase [Aestuariivirga litoralis]